MTSRFAAGVRSHGREFFRARVNVVLLVVLPIVLVEGFGRAMGVVPDLPFMEAVPANRGRMLGAVFSTAFITGLLGLFQIVSAQRADRRLVQTGYSAAMLLATRLATVAGFGLLVATVSFGVLRASLSLDAPVVAFLALILAGVTYGLLGVLVGAVVPNELTGSLVLVFIADLDGFLGVGLRNPPAVKKLFPLHYAQTLFESAALDGTVAAGNVVGGLVYGGVLAVLVILAFRQAMRTEGVV
ncbi:hypothetical protein [Halorussus caseinilyticus]|uniref:ABC transporter permease n=1 Tax=Halorussus caseinilyticus TaxID=3034025 RepID=A0ABD5WIT4_9EURY|nr:hypothetical protein [Halorussus sp. DT72]